MKKLENPYMRNVSTPMTSSTYSIAVGVSTLSTINIGSGLTIHVDKRFNWLQRKMMKIAFGWAVKNVSK